MEVGYEWSRALQTMEKVWHLSGKSSQDSNHAYMSLDSLWYTHTKQVVALQVWIKKILYSIGRATKL